MEEGMKFGERERGWAQETSKQARKCEGERNEC